MKALQYGEPPEVFRDVRPGLDLIAGGPLLHRRGGLSATAAQSGLDMVGNLMNALAAVWRGDQSAAVLIDSGPGDAPLLDALLQVSRYLVVPTRETMHHSAAVELLHCVISGHRSLARSNYSESCSSTSTPVPRPATRRYSPTWTCCSRDRSHLFPMTIRSERGSRARSAYRPPHTGELVTSHRPMRVRRGLPDSVAMGGTAPTTRLDEVDLRLWSRTHALANDYQALARKCCDAIAAAEQLEARA